MNSDILGQGFAFPLHINPQGGLRQSRHQQKIEQSIRIILGTQHGERLMRPDFGCNLRSLVFAPNNTATANLARHYVEQKEYDKAVEYYCSRFIWNNPDLG